MYNYTLAFIFASDEVLLLNRNKKPWQGCWNGVGGKIQNGESIPKSLTREIVEETGIEIQESALIDCGIVTWNVFDALGSGLYLYAVFLDHKPPVNPRHTEEGILDWKKVDWVMDPSNLGIAHNIPFFLSNLYNKAGSFHYHCVFEDEKLQDVVTIQYMKE